MTGDGFGGRGWYVGHNYHVGAYAAYTVCGSNNQMYAWGGNSMGQLGNGSYTSTVAPVAVTGMSNVKFSTAGYLSAAIKTDNSAWVWGFAPYNNAFTNIPVKILDSVKFVDGGASHIVFVKNDSTVWAAGTNLSGELGNGTTSTTATNIPVQMAGINNAVRAIAVGFPSIYIPPADVAATIILLADGTVKVTGGGFFFQQVNSTTPVTVPGLTNIIDIKGTARAAFALNSSGEVYSFGRDFLGLGSSTPGYTAPTKLTFPPGAASIVALSANDDGASCLALDSNHNVYGWGYNWYGTLGDGTNVNILVPKLLATDVIDILAGETFSYILKSDNSLWAAGACQYGMPGYGSIWLNLPNVIRNVFTQIDPTIAPFNLCAPKVFGVVPLQFNTTVSICSNDTYQLQSGVTVSIAGTYIDTIRNNTFLDSIIQTIHLIVNDDTHVNVVDSIEAGQTYTLPSGQVVNTVGTYQSVLVNSLGCDSIITTELKLKKAIVGCLNLFNNAITPNGDGINDSWVLFTNNCFRRLEVNVYNRYGSLVYHADDYKNDWKGTYKNKPLPDGTYYYVINLSSIDDRKQVIKGNITIVR